MSSSLHSLLQQQLAQAAADGAVPSVVASASASASGMATPPASAGASPMAIPGSTPASRPQPIPILRADVSAAPSSPSLLGSSLSQQLQQPIGTPLSPMVAAGIVAPHGTPVAGNGFLPGTTPPHSPSLLNPNASSTANVGSYQYYQAPHLYAQAAARATHFDPYPSAPAPTPASSYVADAAGPLSAESLLSSSAQQRQLDFNTNPFPSSVPSTPTTPTSANYFPPPPPSNSLVTPAPWPAAASGVAVGSLTASLDQLSTANPASSGTSAAAPSTSAALGTSPRSTLMVPTAATSARPRRRSSLSIVSTPFSAGGTLGTSSLSSALGSESVGSSLAPAAEERDDEVMMMDVDMADPDSAAVAAAAALLGVKGAALANNGRPRSRSGLAPAAVSSSSAKTFLCDECGKMFSNSALLSTHRRDHAQYWRDSNKLQLPSHQQVQLVEAAKGLGGVAAAEPAIVNVKAPHRPADHGSGTTTSSESTLPSSPAADDDIMFPMHDDLPSAVA
ncbi:hypothetical protein H9P43_000910 [Blastocladiella emersonii ATCC 22665]|nr:hypothetical protein H9P43_000910 [Blastocladiella emersonii ATCC 22665]